MLNDCCEVMKQAYLMGLITSRDGNISFRFKEQNFFHISPSDVRKSTLITSQFIQLSNHLDSESQQPRNLSTHESARLLSPSGEWPLHYMLQSIIPDHLQTRVVIHVHSPYTIAAMHRGIPLHDLRAFVDEMGRYTRVAPTVGNTPPVSWTMARAVAENLHLDPDTGECDSNVVGIKGHGVVALDKDPWRAFEHVERLEAACKIALHSI